MLICLYRPSEFRGVNTCCVYRGCAAGLDRSAETEPETEPAAEMNVAIYEVEETEVLEDLQDNNEEADQQ